MVSFSQQWKQKVQRDEHRSTVKGKLQSAKTQASSASLCRLPPHSKMFWSGQSYQKRNKSLRHAGMKTPRKLKRNPQMNRWPSKRNAAYSLAQQLTADCPQFEFVRSRKQLSSCACIAQSKHCNISKQPHWTFCLSDTRYQCLKKDKTHSVPYHHDENQENKKVRRR